MTEGGIERSLCKVLFVKDVRKTQMHHQIKFKEIEGHNVEEHEERLDILRRLSRFPEQKEISKFREGRMTGYESKAAKKE
jgi:hypothetical protein